MAVRGWGCAKDVIPWELGMKEQFERGMVLERRAIPHPPVFFVRVANKGLRLDAASREEKGLRVDPSTPLRADSSKLKGEKAERRLILRRPSRQAVDPSTPLPSRLRVNRAGSLKLKGEVSPRGFCERVRKSMKAGELTLCVLWQRVKRVKEQRLEGRGGSGAGAGESLRGSGQT